MGDTPAKRTVKQTADFKKTNNNLHNVIDPNSSPERSLNQEGMMIQIMKCI